MNHYKTGADILLETLQECNIDTIFGYPGGASIPLYNSFATSNVRHILSRHEQGAAFMAQGYARSTDKIGVVDATSGPGVANTFTAIADAYKDSIPMLLISGQVVSCMIGKDAFQELETEDVFSGITKYFKQISSIEEIVPEILKALDIAQSGRPGPVHIDIPKDILLTKYTKADQQIIPKNRSFNVKEEDIFQCIDMIQKSQRPVFLVGHGIKLSRAQDEMLEFIDTLGIPTTETALAKGLISPDNKNALGMLGMHGMYQANMAVSRADLIINIGSRFDDRIVGNYKDFGAGAKIIHIDIDPKELGKIVETDLKIHCDAKIFLKKILTYSLGRLKIENWKEQISLWRNEKPYIVSDDVFGGKQVLKYISDIAKNLSDEVIYGVDVGQHQMWATQILDIRHPDNWLFSGGFGTMGFSLPASIGAAVANPDKKIISISGDGGFQMNLQELGVLIQKNKNTLKDLDIKIIILDNEYLGMVKQWQDMFEENTRSSVDILSPDFDLLAQAYGISTYRIDNLRDMKSDMKNILETPGPTLIWCQIEKEENVFPMVPAGKRLDEMIFD